MELTRLLHRIAVLYVAAASMEVAGRALHLHTSHDEAAPRIIKRLGSWAAAVVAAEQRGEQPIMINIRGTADAGYYGRIARALALQEPVFSGPDGSNPPTVTKMWPSIHKAVAVMMMPTDTLTPLNGPIHAREVAIVANYLCNVYGVREQFMDILETVAMFSHRPGGSTAHDCGAPVIGHLPRARLAGCILLPLLQPAAVSGAVEVVTMLDEPEQLLVRGCMRAAVHVSSISAVLSESGRWWLPYLPRLISRTIRRELGELIQNSIAGVPLVGAAARLSEARGWEKGMPEHAIRFGPRTAEALRSHAVIQATACIPFVTAHPANSAILGILKPSMLDTMPPYGHPFSVSVVKGRHGLNDAFYSLLAAKGVNRVAIWSSDNSGLSNVTKCDPQRTPTGALCDGQFGAVSTELGTASVVGYIDEAEVAIRAMTGHQKRSKWSWWYEWLVPFTSRHAVEQRVELGGPGVPHIPTPMPAEEYVVIPKDVYARAKYSHDDLRPVAGLGELHGEAVTSIEEAYAAMQPLIGKEIKNTLYQENARLYANSVLRVRPTDARMIYGDDEIAALGRYMERHARFAEQVDMAPGRKTELAACADVWGRLAADAEMYMEYSAVPDPPIPPPAPQPEFVKNALDEAEQLAAVAAGFRDVQIPGMSTTGATPATEPAQPQPTAEASTSAARAESPGLAVVEMTAPSTNE
jgi:hypothetical protein